MAKKEELRNQKSKITVMLFQLEGTDETLQEGMRTISQALGAVLKPVRMIPAKIADSPGSEESPLAEEAVETEVNDQPTEDRNEQRETRPSKPRSPKILDLDIKNAPVSLKDFCETKKVGLGDSDRYIVIAYWLKENLKLNEVTMDHIHTCYRFLNWQTPSDASSPLRNMKQQGWFNKGAEKGGYVINHVGENKVMGMGNGK